MDASLNEPQQMAVDRLRGPLLVLAGAGSGKTRVVTARIANLIENGIAAHRILAVTFTNKAAHEMQSRVFDLIDRTQDTSPHISTFHSLCVGILRRQVHALGYPGNYTIIDTGDQSAICRKVLREIRVPDRSLKPRDLIYQIGYWKNRGVKPAEATREATADKEHLAAVAFRRYQDELFRCGLVDFDDLLLLTDRLFHEFPDVLAAEANRFDHLLIDEYQDTNDIQYRIVTSLAAKHGNLCVVGDDDQSIYGFRGSDVSHILNFEHDWPGALTVRLESNYRSTEAILEVANRLIRFNRSRYDKSLTAARPGGKQPRIEQYADEEHEAQQVVSSIRRELESHGRSANDIAILFRTNEQPRLFETELRKHDIPYVLLGSRSFFDRKEVKDLIAYLKVLYHPEDEASLRRIVNNPPRGISASTVTTLVDRATQRGDSLWQVMSDPEELLQLKIPARMAIRNFQELVKHQQQSFKSDFSIHNFHRFLTAVEYKKEVVRHSDDENEQEQRWNSVEEVANALGSYVSRSSRACLGGFLDELALASSDIDDDKDSQLDRDAVALLTLHASKGLEFPVVYMVGMEEGLLPHHRAVVEDGSAIDEERRLAYVGITRAQDELTLSMALSRRKWGKDQSQHPSRFLFELIGQADNPITTPQVRRSQSTQV
ncbi:MAG: UvrD-helicase domain-containing protein [Planctomycetota bacterium]|nr:UvrD-helicase domain-containing protein [Planctomycetota bacterium]